MCWTSSCQALACTSFTCRRERTGCTQVHIRNFGYFHPQLWDDMLADLQPLTESDVLMVNFGAWCTSKDPCMTAAHSSSQPACRIRVSVVQGRQLQLHTTEMREAFE